MSRQTLRPDEHIKHRWRASITRGNTWLAHGGWLELTSERLMFVPNSIGPLRDGNPWAVELDQISGLTVRREESRRAVWTGGLIEYLDVQAAGSVSFIMNNPEDAQQKIEAQRA